MAVNLAPRYAADDDRQLHHVLVELLNEKRHSGQIGFLVKVKMAKPRPLITTTCMVDLLFIFLDSAT